MARRMKVPPFPQVPREPAGELLFSAPWEVEAGEGSDAEHWDYMVDMTFRRGIQVGPSSVREHLQLSTQARVALFAEWRTDLSTYAAGRGPEVELTLEGHEPVDVTVIVPIRGMETGGTLTLLTQMILLEEPAPLAGGPRLAGSILWESLPERHVLESPGARLPVSVVDFEKFPHQFASPRAAWTVHTRPGALLQAPSLGMQIYLNSKHRELVDQLVQADASSGQNLARRMLLVDVGRQLLQSALKDESFTDPDHTFPPGSLGDALRRRVGISFGPLTLPQVKALAEEDAASFEVQWQGALLEGG